MTLISFKDTSPVARSLGVYILRPDNQALHPETQGWETFDPAKHIAPLAPLSWDSSILSAQLKLPITSPATPIRAIVCDLTDPAKPVSLDVFLGWTDEPFISVPYPIRGGGLIG